MKNKLGSSADKKLQPQRMVKQLQLVREILHQYDIIPSRSFTTC